MGRILIADDDPSQLDLRKTLLESAGHYVRAAFSPTDAQRQAGQRWAELLILDLRMPEAAHGLALIRSIRESGCETPILILSGWPDDLYGRPEELMVSRILIKPLQTADLLGAINLLLANA